MNKRIVYIDTAKALAILLVIIGHCYWKGAIMYVDSLIYSFHLPLFFVISGMFVKDMGLFQGVKKYAKAYLKPYFITCLLIAVMNIASAYSEKSDSFDAISQLKTEIIRILFASGWPHGDELFAETPAIGCLWFLFALFWACVIYSYLKKCFNSFERVIWVFALFALSYLSIQKVRLPFSFQAGCSAVLFLWAGDLIRSYSLIERMRNVNGFSLLLGVGIWMISIVFTGGISVSVLDYGIGIVKLPVAIIACCLVLHGLMRTNAKGGWIGRNTLYVLCGHKVTTTTLGTIGINMGVLPFLPFVNFFAEAIIQIVIALFVGWLFVKIHLF